MPDRNFGWTIIQDYKSENLLFAGTEYGLFFSVDGGNQWVQLKSGLPTIAIRDLEIQQRENDLVAASFGRGFYILDDFSPLREISQANLAKQNILFPVKDALSYTIDNPDGYAIGANFYSSPNPTFGAVFTYYNKDATLTSEKKRQKMEAQKVANNQPVEYPDWDSFTREKREDNPQIMFTIQDDRGEMVARVGASARQGINRTAWNLRYAGNGALVTAGSYTVSMAKLVNGNWQDLEQSQSFKVNRLENTTFPITDQVAQDKFRAEVMALDQVIRSSRQVLANYIDEMEGLKRLVKNQTDEPTIIEAVESIRQKLMDLEIALRGNNLITRNMELIPPSIANRVGRIRNSFRSSTGPSTGTQKDSYAIASVEFAVWAAEFNKVNIKINELENSLTKSGIIVQSGKQQINWQE